MTKVFLIVSVACNVWFLLMLLSDRITGNKIRPVPQRGCRIMAVVGNEE